MPSGLICGGSTFCDARRLRQRAVTAVSDGVASAVVGSVTTTRSGPVRARAEALGDQVVGLPLRRRGGQVAVVGLAQAHRQERDRQRAAGWRRPGSRTASAWRATVVAHRSHTDARGDTSSAAACRGRAIGVVDEARDLPAVDAVADQPDHGGQQGERGDHHHRDDDPGHVPEARDVGDAGDRRVRRSRSPRSCPRTAPRNPRSRPTDPRRLSTSMPLARFSRYRVTMNSE